MVNLVDPARALADRLLYRWLVTSTCSAPAISRSYEAILVSLEEKRFRIAWRNPLRVEHRFLLRCDKPDMVYFQENEMEFKANETRHLEIVFKPQPPGTESLIYICVNDSQDRVIETIAVSAKTRT